MVLEVVVGFGDGGFDRLNIEEDCESMLSPLASSLDRQSPTYVWKRILFALR